MIAKSIIFKAFSIYVKLLYTEALSLNSFYFISDHKYKYYKYSLKHSNLTEKGISPGGIRTQCLSFAR